MGFYNTLESYFVIFVQYGIFCVEVIGVCVLLFTAFKAVISLFRKNPHTRLELAEGIALALEFKLGGEVLRTVIVREKSELITLGAIIALRGALTFLIQWEIKNEEKKMAQDRKR